MRVIWTPEAEQDRDDIWNYIADDNSDAATLMDELFSDAAARLVTYPMLGRIGKMRSSRKRCGYWPWFIRPASGRRCASERGLSKIRGVQKGLAVNEFFPF